MGNWGERDKRCARLGGALNFTEPTRCARYDPAHAYTGGARGNEIPRYEMEEPEPRVAIGGNSCITRNVTAAIKQLADYRAGLRVKISARQSLLSVLVR